jgi:hypothetical protein
MSKKPAENIWCNFHVWFPLKFISHRHPFPPIVSELEALGVQMDDEDKALRLIWSLPSSYEHMKPILIHGKEKIFLSKSIINILRSYQQTSVRGKKAEWWT